jgi:putative transposase
MNPPKCTDEDYINFLVATPKVCSATEAARVQPENLEPAAHDAYTRLLQRLEPAPATLWQEAQRQVALHAGLFVFDDSTLDHPYARKIELVVRHWSGKHHAVVRGINRMTWLWTDGDPHVPCDYRIFDNQRDGLTQQLSKGHCC